MRANIDGELHELAEPPKLDKNKKHTIEVFVDRLVKKDGIRQRLTDSIELAAKLAEGIVKISPLEGDDLLFSEKFACIDLRHHLSGDHAAPVLVQQPGRRLPGLRRHRRQDVLRPRPHRPRRGAVAAARAPSSRGSGATAPSSTRSSTRSAAHFEIDQYVAVGQAARRSTRKLLLEGSARRGGRVLRSRRTARKHKLKKEFEGVLANLERRFDEYERRRREQGRTTDEDFEAIYDEFHRYMSQTVCEECERHAPAQGGALRQGRRQEHHRDDRADHPRGARLLQRAARCRRAQKEIAERILREIGRPAVVPDQRRRRLPVARPHRGDAVGRRVAAHPAGHADRQLAGRRALHPRRAVDRPAPARQRAPAARR